MEKRYQVFVSSTYEDLKDERKKVIEHLLNAKYIPTGMEMFSASNDEQFKYIKKILDDCDYYVLIIGGRYGSINISTGISYTEQEYDYAISKGIPVLTFLHSDPENLPPEKREDDKKVELGGFRAKVSKDRMCKPWSNVGDLTSSVIISLIEEISTNPRLGWTRGNIYDSAELLTQINTLRIEKEEQERVINGLQKSLESNVELDDLASGNEIYIIKGKGATVLKLTWDQIFSAVAPYLFSPVTFAGFGIKLEEGLNSLFRWEPWTINKDCVQTIKIQLLSLNLIEVTQGKIKDGGIMEFIILTEKGKIYLQKIKAIKKV